MSTEEHESFMRRAIELARSVWGTTHPNPMVGALVVEEGVSHAEVVAALGKNRNKFLERVELFDIYRGSSIPTGKKSMAYSLTFRAADKTLTDAEVNGAHEQLKRSLVQTLHCEIRES